MNAFGKKLLPLMVALAGILSVSCTSNLKDKVELVSYSVVSTTVTGPRSADAAIRLEVSNKTSSFKVKHIEGTVNLNGLPLAYLTVEPDPVKVKGHVTGIYDLNVHAVLDEPAEKRRDRFGPLPGKAFIVTPFSLRGAGGGNGDGIHLEHLVFNQ